MPKCFIEQTSQLVDLVIFSIYTTETVDINLMPWLEWNFLPDSCDIAGTGGNSRRVSCDWEPDVGARGQQAGVEQGVLAAEGWNPLHLSQGTYADKYTGLGWTLLCLIWCVSTLVITSNACNHNIKFVYSACFIVSSTLVHAISNVSISCVLDVISCFYCPFSLQMVFIYPKLNSFVKMPEI